jgi:hypothetical protein
VAFLLSDIVQFTRNDYPAEDFMRLKDSALGLSDGHITSLVNAANANQGVPVLDIYCFGLFGSGLRAMVLVCA